MTQGLTPLPDNVQLKILPAKEAVDYLKERGLDIQTSLDWKDVWQQEHATQFTVSRMTSADLLADIHDALMASATQGTGLKEFQATLIPKLQAAGWWGKNEVIDQSTGEMLNTTFDPARLKLIYDVNMSTAYSAGLWNRVERNKKILPYMYYRTMRDEHVRVSHRAWDGVALPVDDPFWDTHYPPNGWRCRCTAYGIDEKGLKNLESAGLPVKREAPPIQMFDFVNKRTGEITRTPLGIDPGFAYNPGKAAARATNLANLQADKIASLPAQIGLAAIDLVTPEETAARYAAWKNFVQTAQQGQAGKLTQTLGFLDAKVLDWLTKNQAAPQTIGIDLQANLLSGVKQIRHETAGDALTDEEWLVLPKLFDNAEHAYWDKKNQTVMIATQSLTDPRKIKLAIAIDFVIKTADGKRLSNSVRTAFKVVAITLEDKNLYEQIW